MKKEDFEKPKKILFEKLTVKETEKARGGDPLVLPMPSDGCQQEKSVGGIDTLPPPIPVNNCV
jgi:hypothetical protein